MIFIGGYPRLNRYNNSREIKKNQIVIEKEKKITGEGVLKCWNV